MSLLRLDRILSEYTPLSRREATEKIRKGLVLVNRQAARDPSEKYEVQGLLLSLEGQERRLSLHNSFMLYKPAGVVSATRDARDTTVLDLIRVQDRYPLLSPAGRLDKDSEGLMILTSDGGLCHRIISPASRIFKQYRIRVRGPLGEEHIRAVAEGIPLSEEELCLPGELMIDYSGECSQARIRICEGKFHQVKRMMEALDRPVLSLFRESIGGLVLDETLAPGQYRPLDAAEILKIFDREP